MLMKSSTSMMYACEKTVLEKIHQEEHRLLWKLPEYFRATIPYQYCLITREENSLKENVVYLQLKNIRDAFKKHGSFKIAYIDGISSF